MTDEKFQSLCDKQQTLMISEGDIQVQKRGTHFSQVPGIMPGTFIFYSIVIKAALRGKCIVKVGLESGPHGAGLEYLVPVSAGMGTWSHSDGVGGGGSLSGKRGAGGGTRAESIPGTPARLPHS